MAEFPKLIALKKLTSELGVSRTTVFRYRKHGWLKTVEIAGKPFVTEAAWQSFVTRAEAGEFAIASLKKGS